MLQGAESLPFIDAAAVSDYARTLPNDLRLVMLTLLRIREYGEVLRTFNLPALVRAACWRIDALATFHGDRRWQVDDERLVDATRAATMEQVQIRWADVRRTSTC